MFPYKIFGMYLHNTKALLSVMTNYYIKRLICAALKNLTTDESYHMSKCH